MLSETITCTECSGPAHRVGYPPPDDEEPGEQIAVFICGDCGHRMDVVLEETSEDGPQAG